MVTAFFSYQMEQDMGVLNVQCWVGLGLSSGMDNRHLHLVLASSMGMDPVADLLMYGVPIYFLLYIVFQVGWAYL